jgi:lipopolysaccharide transport system ATP-binding protein
MSDLAIRVEGLSKSFRLGHKLQSHRFTEFIENIGRTITRLPKRLVKTGKSTNASSPELFWALDDVSFDVHKGEVFGFVGRNGAGKSTLLKLLSRIMYPTRGRIEIRGRVRSLLEVGTGFHHDLTGRENIFLNGAVLGMTQREIRQKFDEIVEFSEVERFLDTPVKYYSSGMYVRLAFAVAAHLEPEILIVDEVLAVGDAAFQQKCLGKMGAVSRQGKTVLIVSHSLPIVTNLCQRAILLEKGRVAMIGSANEVARQYLASVRSASGEVIWTSPESAPGSEMARLRSVRIVQRGIDGPTTDVDISKEIDVQISYWNLIPEQQLFTALWLKNINGVFVLATSNVKSVSSTDDPWYGKPQPVGVYESTCTIPGNFLNQGRYQISAIIGRVPGRTIHVEESVLTFDVHDTGAMHEEFFGNYTEPVIRPRLPWHTVQQPTD